jgi:hypothetical protein
MRHSQKNKALNSRNLGPFKQTCRKQTATRKIYRSTFHTNDGSMIQNLSLSNKQSYKQTDIRNLYRRIVNTRSPQTEQSPSNKHIEQTRATRKCTDGSTEMQIQYLRSFEQTCLANIRQLVKLPDASTRSAFENVIHCNTSSNTHFEQRNGNPKTIPTHQINIH